MITQLKTHTLFCLRHGQLEQQKVLAGHTDFLLSKKGWQQLRNAVSKLPHIARIYSSPLKRCSLFADELSVNKGISLEIDTSLKEMNFGEWDGQLFAHLWQKPIENKSVSIGEFWENPWLSPPPNGETMHQFSKRVDTWWQCFLNNPQQGNSLLISHAGVIKHLLARVAKLNIKQPELLNVFTIDYAGVVRIDITYDEHQRAWPCIVF